MSPEYRERFFERAEHGYRITKPLRQMVIFGQQNLSTSSPFPRLDLVICRNVLIYFTPELQDYVLKQFAFSLHPGGYLFLGKAEAVRPMQSYYELINKHWKVYRCIGNAGQLRRLNERLLRFLPVGIVIIDRAYHIISANSTARKLLELRDTSNEQDFWHAVRGIPYNEIRTAIDTVFRERQLTNLPEVELNTTTTSGSGHYLSLSIAPMQLEAKAPDLAVISITEVTQQVHLRQKLDIEHNKQSQLMNELGAANKRLNDMNKELTDANEELQVANEEPVLTHEELQATNAEFEITNEELQATNEELETTNDELRARTHELQELTEVLENERGRLAGMVELAPLHILVLRGPSLIVEAYNPRYARLFEGKVVQGRPIDEVSDLFWKGGVEIVQRARDAYRLDQVQKTPRTLTYFPKSPGKPGEIKEIHFTYTIVPAHNSSGKVDSVILYAVDETEQCLHEVEEERERLQLIFENFSMAAVALFDAHTAKLLMGSPRYFDVMAQKHHAPADQLLGSQWTELTFITPPEEALAIWENVQKTRESHHIAEFSAKILPESEELIWDYHLIPLLDSENSQEVRFMLVLAFEITSQVRARKELEKLDALKDEFLSITAHELRTPLTAMLGNAQILQRMLRHSEDEQAEKTKQEQNREQEAALLEKVISEIHQVNKLLTEMVDVARICGEVFTLHSQEKVDVVELARQVVENYQGITKHEIRIDSEEKAIEGNYDAGRIEQVLNNLLSNALKYSPDSEPVLITIKRQSCSPSEVVVSVKDNGDGISAEAQPHIFERFYRAPGAKKGKADGLGLGLYISHEIIARQGGRLWLESEPGHGSTFSFALPLDETPG
jgi:two-component system CheB/CheR fusion protein